MSSPAPNNNNRTAVATVGDKNQLNALLSREAVQKSLADVLPKHLTPERVVKMALVAASRQPTLLKCTSESFLKAIMTSAELGLDCSGTLGSGYLVPFYNKGVQEVQFIPGYRGLIDLARRSGSIARIESRIVYAQDVFEIEYGLDQKLIHKPKLTGDRGDIVCVYGIAELTDGTNQVEVMTIDEVEAIRKRSKAGDSGPWRTDFGEMARKTVIRRLVKYLPLSTELEKALVVSDEEFNHSDNAANMAAATAERGEALRAQLEARQAGQDAEDQDQTDDRIVVDGELVDTATGEVIETPAEPEATPVEDPTAPEQDPKDAMLEDVLNLANLKSDGIEADMRALLGGKSTFSVMGRKTFFFAAMH